jgi:hypothetical protein
LFESPRIGLIFLVPGKRETLRISGEAEVVRDAELLETLVANGKTPALAIAVHVEEAFFHCAKCIIRSHLWQPERWPSIEGLPTLAETMKDAASIPAPVDILEAIIKEDEENRRGGRCGPYSTDAAAEGEDDTDCCKTSPARRQTSAWTDSPVSSQKSTSCSYICFAAKKTT